MQRRSFIKTGASAGAGIALGPHTLRAFSTRRSSGTDVTVIGAGVFGVWTAFYLQELGARVTLVDAYGPGNSRASSGGESRILRADYGDRLLYSRLNTRAYRLWTDWQQEWNTKFLYKTGRLTLGSSSMRQKAEAAIDRLSPLGIQGEVLDQNELAYRWPQVNFDGIETGLYFPGGAGGSTLMAREACRVVGEQFVRKGGKLVIGKVLPPKTGSGGRIDTLSIVGQPDHVSDTYIFACGPWMPRVFPDVFSSRIKVYRRDVLFVGTPAGDDRYSHPNFPVWIFNDAENGRYYYGMPDLRGRGLKVAPWPDLNTIDMDRDDRTTNPNEITRTRSFVGRRFPGLADQPVTETRVCQLSMSSDEHFIVDRHPELTNAWMVCAGSGHGFKHGPALGQYVAERLLNAATDAEFDTAFRLK